MGQLIELTAADGHRFSAWKAMPEGPPRGGLVVIQESFGMTGQMKPCAEKFAAPPFGSIVG